MVQIEDTADFVVTLISIEEALRKANRLEEANQARRLRTKFQNLCPHESATTVNNKFVGKCLNCLREFPTTTAPELK